jgi:protease-4
MLDKMSPANREQMQLLLDELWGELAGDISESRNISLERLNEIADDLLVREPADAVELKLVDELVYRDQLNKQLKEKIGLMEDEKMSLLSFKKYDNAVVSEYRKKFSKEKIAVIYALGAINSGEGSDTEIGSERIAETIRKARMDSTIKAIVFRVNSPGGSALASDVIWRETVLAKEAKPFIVSFGDVAASGGYYISTHADKIFASPTTVTGSIGVFGVIPNFKGIMNDFGVTTDEVKTNKNSSYISVTRPMTAFEADVMLDGIKKVYKTFTGKVAEGRQMNVEEVYKIAEGRVWPGTTAKDIELVDEFGGLYDAIDEAAEMAGLEEYRLLSWPKQQDPITQMIEEITGQKQTSILKSELGPLYPYYESLKTMSEMEGIQARLPFEFTIY